MCKALDCFFPIPMLRFNKLVPITRTIYNISLTDRLSGCYIFTTVSLAKFC